MRLKLGIRVKCVGKKSEKDAVDRINAEIVRTFNRSVEFDDSLGKDFIEWLKGMDQIFRRAEARRR